MSETEVRAKIERIKMSDAHPAEKEAAIIQCELMIEKKPVPFVEHGEIDDMEFE